jgi:GNAT superfamily N-acetyltransferase
MNVPSAEAVTPKSQWIDYHLRPMEPGDSAAYTELMANSPETGLVTIQTIFKIDPYEMLMKRRIGQIVVVAETPQGQVVGAAAADWRPIWFESQPSESVHLHSLFVHPQFRQQGVATALTKWRIRWAREKYGANILIFAEIETDNIASFKAAEKWATAFGQPREIGFLRVFTQPPKPIPDVETREASQEDYPAIVAGLNQFNHDVDFTRYITLDRLHRNLEPIHGQVFRHRFVVLEDRQIVGGAVLSFHDPSVETRLIKAPLLNRFMARMTGMIGSDNVIRGGEVDGIWFKPGHADAVHYLVQHLRHRAYPETTALNFRVSNPKAWEALQLNHWAPHTVLSTAYLRPKEVKRYVEAAPVLG